MPVCAKTQPTPPHHQDPSLQRSVALRKPLPLGAVVECRPARLPAGIEHEKYDILTLISKLEMLGFEPCASDHFLAVPQLELPALPPLPLRQLQRRAHQDARGHRGGQEE